MAAKVVARHQIDAALDGLLVLRHDPKCPRPSRRDKAIQKFVHDGEIAPDDPPRPGVVDRRGTAPRQLADEPSVEAGAKQADEQVGARYLREMERTATVVGGGIAGLA